MAFSTSADLVSDRSSPEVMVKAEPSERACWAARFGPIANAPQGQSEAEDQALEQELLGRSQRKGRACEMLVDPGLATSWAGSCRLAASRSPDLMVTLSANSHVMHIVSQVEGLPAADQEHRGLLQASFPRQGTVSGAQKKSESMQLIHELETRRRGPYSHGVYGGAVDLGGALTTAITNLAPWWCC